MRLGAILLDKKTNIAVSIGTLFLVAGFIITTVFYGTGWVTRTNAEIDNNKKAILKEERERKAADITISEEMKLNRELLLTNQTSMATIEADLKWVIKLLEERSE